LTRKDDFYPVMLRTDPPTILTREEVERKVPCIKITHIPATCPRDEKGAQSGPQ